MNRGDDGHAQRLHARQQVLPHSTHALGLGGRAHLEELLDVGADDERLRLPGDQYDSLDERIVVDAEQDALELADERCGERVDALARTVDVTIRTSCSTSIESVGSATRRRHRSITMA